MKASTPDRFDLPKGSRFGEAHDQIADYLENSKARTLPAESVKLDKPAQLALLCAAVERVEFQKGKGKGNPALSELIKKLAGRKLPYTEESLVCIASCAANILTPKDPNNVQFEELDSPIPGLVPALLDQLDTLASTKPLSKELLEPLERLHAAVKPVEFWAGNKKSVLRMEALLAQKKAGVPDDGEAWAEAIQEDIKRMPAAQCKHWLALLKNAPKGTNAKPTAKWKQDADELLAAVG